MNLATEGPRPINLDFCGLAFGKDKERGLKVVEGASKNSIFNEKMDIRVERSSLRENDTLETENGKIIEFKKGSFATLKENRNNRKTKKEIERENI